MILQRLRDFKNPMIMEAKEFIAMLNCVCV